MTTINGFCEPRFQPLLDAFGANFDEGLEVGASLAATHQGRFVADLWAGHADAQQTHAWERDTIVQVSSTTKIPLILSFLMLVDRELVELDATVATYWPEFAAGGKARVTVRDALTHSAGVPKFDGRYDAMYDWDASIARIAAEPHAFEGRRVLCYHGWTYGFLLGEIMRRVDGRRPAQFFREEIAEKADIDFQMGLRSQHDCARLAAEDWLLPLAGGVWSSFALDVPTARRSWEDRRAEVPAGNGYANGRSIARLCAIGALGGELDGVRYLSSAMIAEAAREQIYAECPVLGWLRLGLGFGLHSKEFPGPSPTSFQWGGWGGSVGMMDPAPKVSFGYATNHFVKWPDPRGIRFRQALGEVITRL